ncbi:MAG TPA: hypothetical protein PLF85_17400 [Turneriella sp.]|nr:hypothetical protein [Turneriella sp.]
MKPGPQVQTPTGLIVLASGQVMPNIKSLLWAIKKANLSALAIVASGVDESQKAADRLAKLVTKINAGKIADFRTNEPVAVEVFVERDIDRFPERLSPRLTSFIEKRREKIPHWMINFTAGSKIMFLSLLSHFRTSVQEWHYLEGARSGRWSRYRIDQDLSITTEELEIPDYVAGCIIGNRKTRKFHVPEGRYYNQAKESKNRVFFKNAADAEKAGYTKSAR